MPISRRTKTPALQPVANPAAPKDDAVLSAFKDPVRAAMVLYDEKDTKDIPLGDLLLLVRKPQNDENVDRVYRNRIHSRMTGIRAFCVFCVGGQPKRVRLCDKIDCSLWPFRLGTNPFRRDK